MSSNRTSEDDAADKECINAFKIDTSHVFQKDRNAKCAPDTGQWFFHHPEYEKFQSAKGLQLLFVTAEAGGKHTTWPAISITVLTPYRGQIYPYEVVYRQS